MAKMKVDVQPLTVPSEVGVEGRGGTVWFELDQVPTEVLSDLADEFRRNLFKDAGKRDPRETAKEAASEQAADTAERPPETTPDSKKTDATTAAYILEGLRNLLDEVMIVEQVGLKAVRLCAPPTDARRATQLMLSLRVIRNMKPIDISGSLVGNQPRPAYGVDAEDLRQVLEILSNSTIHADNEQKLSIEIMTHGKAAQLLQLLRKIRESFWVTRPEYRQQLQDQ